MSDALDLDNLADLLDAFDFDDPVSPMVSSFVNSVQNNGLPPYRSNNKKSENPALKNSKGGRIDLSICDDDKFYFDSRELAEHIANISIEIKEHNLNSFRNKKPATAEDYVTLEKILIEQREFNQKVSRQLDIIMSRLNIQDKVIGKLRKDVNEKKNGLFE